jgi:hypothetical protein
MVGGKATPTESGFATPTTVNRTLLTFITAPRTSGSAPSGPVTASVSICAAASSSNDEARSRRKVNSSYDTDRNDPSLLRDRPIRTNSPLFRDTSGFRSAALTMLNIVVLTAIPSASETTVGTVKAGARARNRIAYRRSNATPI